MTHKSYNLFGSVAVINFPNKTSKKDKLKQAKKIMKENKTIKTVLGKSKFFSGRLRTMKTKFLCGEKTKEVLYKENNCVFRFNLDNSYFSPRLSNERKEMVSKIKKGDEVLVMFAGVAPYSIVVAKNSKCSKVYSNELNKKANKYAEMNLDLNKVKDKVELLPGNIKKVARRLAKIGKKFDVIMMPRPQLKDSFLKEAFMLSKKGTKIYYYDFCKVEDLDSKVEMVREEALKNKRKIKILEVKHAGEIAPYKIRCRIDFEIQ
jgi:tRNA (guanine37-N1)-methyltransferase